MNDKPTHDEPDSNKLSVRVTPEQKRAVRQLALDAGCRNVSEFVIKILSEHTRMNALAATYAERAPDVAQT